MDNRRNNLIHDACSCTVNLWRAARGGISIKSPPSCQRCVIVKPGPARRHRRAARRPLRLRVKNRLRLPPALRAAVTRVNHLHEGCIELMVKVKGGVQTKAETSAHPPSLSGGSADTESVSIKCQAEVNLKMRHNKKTTKTWCPVSNQ